MPDEVRPRHVAIIADGNRRWARERGLPVLAGHIQGIEAIRHIVRRARDAGVETLSVYTFSTENWARPDDEVSGLFGLIDGAVRQYTDELVAEGVRVRVIGREVWTADHLDTPSVVADPQFARRQLHHRLTDTHHSVDQVHVPSLQPSQLAPPQAAECRQKDQDTEPRVHSGC